MSEANDQPRIVLAYNNAVTNDPCAICGGRSGHRGGLDAMLGESYELVCDECIGRWAPWARAYIGTLENPYIGAPIARRRFTEDDTALLDSLIATYDDDATGDTATYTLRDHIAPERIETMRALMVEQLEALQAWRRDYDGWLEMSGDTLTATAADLRILERGNAIAGEALFALWEGTDFNVAMASAHDPWRVTLTYWDTDYGLGESYASAADAIASAIDAALFRIEIEERRHTRAVAPQDDP